MDATVPNLQIDESALRVFCEKWDIAELAVFGSVLRDDFGPESDVDFLVTFGPGERWTIGDIAHMEVELSRMVGRRVEIVERDAVEQNPNRYVRGHILATAQPISVN